jgi:hypothetical protein
MRDFVADPKAAAMPVIALDDLQDCSNPRRRVAVIKIDAEDIELAACAPPNTQLRAAGRFFTSKYPLRKWQDTGSPYPKLQHICCLYDYRCFRDGGDRNSTHDAFELVEMGDLHEGGEFYDLLAVPTDRAATFAALASFAKR